LMSKRMVSLLLILYLLFFALPIRAASSKPEVVLLPETESIPCVELLSILRDHPNARCVTVYLAQNCPAAPVMRGKYASFTTAQSDVYLRSDFVLSLARGQSGTPGEALTFPYDTEIEGDFAPSAAKLGLRSSAGAILPEDFVLSGPAEDSLCNSRSYYIQWRGRTGCWRDYFVYDANPARQGWVSGRFVEPTRWIFYSIDERVD